MSAKLEEMTHSEFLRAFEAFRVETVREYNVYKTEATRRTREMNEVMGLSGKRGRPAENPLANLLSGGEDQESPEKDAASAAVQ